MKRYTVMILLASFLAVSASGCSRTKENKDTETVVTSYPDTEAVEIELSTPPVPAGEDDPEIMESEEPQAEEIVIGSTKTP